MHRWEFRHHNFSLMTPYSVSYHDLSRLLNFISSLTLALPFPSPLPFWESLLFISSISPLSLSYICFLSYHLLPSFVFYLFLLYFSAPLLCIAVILVLWVGNLMIFSVSKYTISDLLLLWILYLTSTFNFWWNKLWRFIVLGWYSYMLQLNPKQWAQTLLVIKAKLKEREILPLYQIYWYRVEFLFMSTMSYILPKFLTIRYFVASCMHFPLCVSYIILSIS